MIPRAVFLSIHPVHGRRILAGTKTHELRRRPPRQMEAALLVLYLTSPVRAVVGVARIGSLITGEPGMIWDRVSTGASLSRDSFERYFAGVREGGALEIADAVALDQAVPLASLRSLWPGFSPPQSFRYLYDVPEAEGLVLETPWGSLSLAPGSRHPSPALSAAK